MFNYSFKSKFSIRLNIAILLLASIWLIAQPEQPQQSTTNQRYHVFCDLGGVCLKRDTLAASKVMGRKRLIKYALTLHHPSKLQEIAFAAMDQMHGQANQTLATNNGLQLPIFMCQLMRGETTPQKLAATICQGCDANPRYFTSKMERELVKGVAKCLLPENLIGTQTTDPDMLKLLAKCKTNHQCELYVLSNLDGVSCQYLPAAFPKLFSNFKPSNLCFSGKMGCMKPEPKIFTTVTNKYSLDPKQCVLIDDQIENVQAAQAAGWQAILHTSAAKTEQILCTLGLFK